MSKKFYKITSDKYMKMEIDFEKIDQNNTDMFKN